MTRVGICLRLVEVFYNSQIEHVVEMNLHQSTPLAEPQKAVEAHGCKPWVCSHATLGLQLINHSPIHKVY